MAEEKRTDAPIGLFFDFANAKCSSCGVPARAWHPHAGYVCDKHLQEVLEKAVKGPSCWEVEKAKGALDTQ